MDEIWKDIPGYEGLYQASTKGRIRSVSHTRTYIKHYEDKDIEATHHFDGRILKQTYTSGYLGVLLSEGTTRKDALVHRLVALTFVPNPDNKPQVDHIDGDRTNNRPENLRWVTSKENHANSIERGEHTSQDPYKRKPVRDIDTGEEFPSMLDAEKHYNIPRGRISGAIKSGQRVHGHRFEIIEAKPKQLVKL